MSNVLYFNGVYTVKKTKYPRHRPYKVYMSKDSSHHTHLRTLKEAIDIANYAKYKSVPRKSKSDYLISLRRLTNCPKFISELSEIISTDTR